MYIACCYNYNVGVEEFNITDSGCLQTVLKPLEAKYDSLAGLIGVDCKSFEKHSGDADRCLSEVIRVWFDMEKEKAPSREALVKALKGIGKGRLARELDQKYKGNYSYMTLYSMHPFPHFFMATF